MHYRNVCKHGLVMGQCRCPGPKADRLVDCQHPQVEEKPNSDAQEEQ